MKLLMLFLICVTPGVAAQYNLKETILNSVLEEHVTEDLDDHNLKGRVKAVLVLNGNKSDTSDILTFNKKGRLTSKFMNTGGRHYVAQYAFNSDGHTIVRMVPSYSYDDTIIHRFHSGRLLETAYIGVDNGEVRRTRMNYKYNKNLTKTTASYNYSYDTDMWDITVKDVYRITYKNGRVIGVLHKSHHKDHVYSSKHTLHYDTLGRVTRASLYSSNYGSNSAIGLKLAVQYNDDENAVQEDMVDLTVRNSLWSYSYSKYRQYNDNGDVVAMSYSNSNWPEMRFPNQNKDAGNEKFDPVSRFRYNYDSYGNWIEKFVVTTEGERLAERREISYYE